MTQKADVIVIGCGGVGSAALYQLAQRGVSAIALDRFPVAHDRGSSHGETRIVRQAYFEQPDYVPLCRKSYDMWDELSEERGRRLRHEVGLVQVGPEDGSVVRGVMESAKAYGLEIEKLSRGEVQARFPGFVVPEGMCGVFEKTAGYVEVEECVRAHAEGAKKRGAEIVSGLTVLGWTATDSGIEVNTDKETFSCDSLIVTAGAWAADLLRDVGVPFEVRRKPLFWFETGTPDYLKDEGTPTFLYEVPEGVFYGFPDLGDGRLKIAEHSGGEPVADPLSVDREMRNADRDRLASFLASHLPGVTGRVATHAVCMYTMTPDENFVVDVHPKHGNVAFAAGLSGHGFKMVPVLGQALADLVLEGGTSVPIGFLSARRFR